MKRIYLICLATLALSVQSCEKWLNVQPTDRQTESQIFATKGGCYSAVNGIYVQLNSNDLYGKELSYNMIECLAQKWVVANSDQNKVAAGFSAYNFTTPETKEVISRVWESAYNLILNCNIVLKNIEIQKSMLGIKDYNIIKGEMLGLRAFIHFDMLRLFGPIYSLDPQSLSIPYNVSSVVKVENILPADQIINNHILVDIENAEKILAQYDPVIKDGPMASSIENEEAIYSEDNIYKYRQLRFNYYAVLLLKARVQLYAGNKPEALITAKSIIESAEVARFFPSVDPTLVNGNSTNPDRMFTSETFFGMYDKNRNLKYKENFDPESAGDFLIQPRKDFVANTSWGMVNDYRLKNQWGVVTSTVNPNPTLLKYKDIVNKNLFYATYIPLMRLSEAYLIASECEPNVFDGWGHLNKLRVNMRGNVGLELDNEEPRSELEYELTNEYVREFAGEGQFFYYIKRINSDISDAGSTEDTIRTANNRSKLVLPLPESELLSR